MDESVKEEAEGVHNTLYVISRSQMKAMTNPKSNVTLVMGWEVMIKPIHLFSCLAMVIGLLDCWIVLFFRAILENIVEFQPEMSKDIAEAGFMAWLIKKLKVN